MRGRREDAKMLDTFTPPANARKRFVILTADYDPALHDLVEWCDGFVVITIKP